MSENCDIEKVKVVIKIVIAVLSAILGGLGEAATGFLSNLLNL